MKQTGRQRRGTGCRLFPACLFCFDSIRSERPQYLITLSSALQQDTGDLGWNPVPSQVDRGRVPSKGLSEHTVECVIWAFYLSFPSLPAENIHEPLLPAKPFRNGEDTWITSHPFPVMINRVSSSLVGTYRILELIRTQMSSRSPAGRSENLLPKV